MVIGGGIVIIFLVGVVVFLMLIGIGFGFGGVGIKIVVSFIEVVINLDKIKKVEEEWKKMFKGIKNMENELWEWVERLGKVWFSVVCFIDFVWRIIFNSVLLFCVFNIEL